MLKAIAFLFIPALLLMPVTASQSFAGDDKQQAAPATGPQKKQEIKTRGFQKNAPAPAAAPPPPPPRGDGGRPDDTIGGLPGHAPDLPARQP